MGNSIHARHHSQWYLTISILVLLGTAMFYDIVKERRKTESVEYDRLKVQARVIDQNLSRQFTATYQSLERLRRDLRLLDRSSSSASTPRQLLQTIEAAMPGIRTLLVIDARGVTRASNRPELTGRDMSGEDFFRTAERRPDPTTFYLSPPHRTPLRVFTMDLSRSIMGPDGTFKGIITATVDPEYFKTLLASVQYAPDMWVAVAHAGGIQFLMVPDQPGQSGKNLAQPGSFFTRHRASGKQETLLTGTVFATGEERVMALRTIDPPGAHLDVPMVLAVGRDLHAVFATWRKSANIYGVLYIAIVLVTVLSVRINQAGVLRAYAQNRRAQEALAESEKRFRLLAENTTDVVWQLDLHANRFTYVSPSVFSLRGYTPEEVLSQPVEASLTPESRKQVQGWIARAVEEFASGRTDPHQALHEVEQPRKDGTTVRTEVSTTYILDGENRPVGVIGISRDITERKRAEQALREGEARFRRLIELAPIPLCFVDGRGTIVYVNDRFVRMFGYTREDVPTLDAWWPRAYPDEQYRSWVLATWSAAVESAVRDITDIEPIEYNVACKDGTIRIVEISGIPIEDSFLATFIDVTGRKRAEDAIKQALAEKETLLKEIHHRVKNNMQVISSLLYLQAQKIRDPAFRAMFQESQLRVKSMALVHERLYESRDLAKVDFREYVAALVQELTTFFDTAARGIKTTISVASGPLDLDAAMPCALIINELLTNAYKYAFPGRGGEVSITFEQRDGACSLTIRDTGIGLPPHLDYRTSLTLGFQLVSVLAKQLRAELNVTTDNGTTVRLTFPFQGDADGAS